MQYLFAYTYIQTCIRTYIHMYINNKYSNLTDILHCRELYTFKSPSNKTIVLIYFSDLEYNNFWKIHVDNDTVLNAIKDRYKIFDIIVNNVLLQ